MELIQTQARLAPILMVWQTALVAHGSSPLLSAAPIAGYTLDGNGNGKGNNGNSNNGNGNGGGGGGGNLYAYIEITTNSSEPLRIDSTRLSEIDGDLDDGNTGSGYFQVSGMSIRYYLEQ